MSGNFKDINNSNSQVADKNPLSEEEKDSLPFFYSQDSDVLFQIDSSRVYDEDDEKIEGEVFDFDMISAAESFDFLFSDSGEEDEDLAFARNPFGGIESRDVFFQDEESFDEDIKSIGADSVTSFINKKAFQNTERLEFSDPTLQVPASSDLTVVKNFMAVRPEKFLFNFDPQEFSKEINTDEEAEAASSILMKEDSALEDLSDVKKKIQKKRV